jgi:hypothetical protein
MPMPGPFAFERAPIVTSETVQTDDMEWLKMRPNIFRLLEWQQKLETQISAEQHRRVPDFFRLLRLKALKLAATKRLMILNRAPQMA